MTATFPPIPYLEWIRRRVDEATYDLATSDLRVTSDDGGVVPTVLEGLPDPEDETETLEQQLAIRYDVPESRVLVTAGASSANYLAACALLDRAAHDLEEAEDDQADDEQRTNRPQVLVEKPGYEPLSAVPEALGARVDRYVRPPEYDYDIEPRRIPAAASESFAYAIVTNRHNPSGRLASRVELAEMARVAADSGGHLLVDEVYAPYVAPAQDGPFGGVSAAGLPNVVTTGSLTKFHGLGGLRIGWMIAGPELVERARSVSMYNPSVADPSRKLARRALHNGEKIATAARDQLSKNHDRLASFVADRPTLSGRIHSGGTFAFLSHDELDGDEVVDAAWEAGVLVVPGRFFDDPESFRIALGGTPDEMDAALDAFGNVLDDLVN
ncbi:MULTISPECIES: pyridoxal phosphate-dependent aminotransferase [Haloferax]|uniref:Aminotransferase n=1 Tax=Haloferax marinum TaxID=2666143 RepID=A0A6A8G2U0_9EURY|nr:MULTISPECIES: pyridoxal phosphate-dependent aminotransferase [Haloferax]KAB1196103.1 pyridoxal phosphate-dependent aminotransferase [Haloferax sp. CBA1150]MRW95087.1 aminotransferase class I/II-fold pyridoxal phosphate-dependent enzyme [Haloferax marinum]